MKEFKVIFWDFDGVIKDSVNIKTEAYEQLFLRYGNEVSSKVRQHHEANGGVSRYEKFPIYLRWAGEPGDAEQVASFCDQFSHLVMQAVIDAPWVPGVLEYLQANHTRQRFVLMTATPQDEMEDILEVLKIAGYFFAVYGAPTPKTKAIKSVLEQLACPTQEALAIGDAETDYLAARENKVPFLLRFTPQNKHLQAKYDLIAFDNLETELAEESV